MAIINCPNKSLPEFQALIAAYGEGRATAAWRNNNEVIPTVEQAAELLGIASPNTVNATLKVVEALGTDKVQKLYDKFYKSNPDKFYSELVPLAGKQQVDILKDYNTRNQPKSLTDMLAGMMAEMAYTVEVNIAKINNQTVGNRFDEQTRIPTRDTSYPEDISSGEYRIAKQTAVERGITINDEDRYEYFVLDGVSYHHADTDYYKKTVEFRTGESSSQYYSNLTVPGGTNYTENEIATPGITPSIKGHAQFSTDQGIGWFRSDDKYYTDSYTLPEGVIIDEDTLPFEVEGAKFNKGKATTRRILEVQSDLFQKGRDKDNLINVQQDRNEVFDYKKAKKAIDSFQNKFLQLLNKDGNWIPFFIKTIVQDSAKKGYEKVLFPTGNTASKIEGHETLEDFKKQKEDRIKELQELKRKNAQIVVLESLYIDDEGGGESFMRRKVFDSREEAAEFQSRNSGWEVVGEEPGYQISATDSKIKFDIDNEIKQLQEELKRVETEGIAALKPIYNFYENRVYRELEKMYSKEGVTRIKDEYGNEWYEIDVVPEVDKSAIFFQQLSTRDILDKIYQGWVINKPILRPLTVPDDPKRYVGWTTTTGNELDAVIAGINRWIKKIAPYSKLRAYKNPKTGAMKFIDDANNEIAYQLISTESKPGPNSKVSKQIEKFIGKLGGKIQYVPQIVVNGKVMPANAIADVISRTIQVIADNESIDTLPEEAAHIYVEWLPDTHPLKQEMLRTIKRSPEYRKTLSEYSKNPLYQNADGTVNTDKIAIEAIGKKIAGAIVGKADKVASTWWQKLWSFIRNIFAGKEDIWNQAASDILSANTSKLDLAAINKAAEQGRYYLQLSPEESRFYNTLSARATEAQKAIIDDLKRNPSVIFQEAGHKYIPVDMNDTTQYTSVTEGIGVEGPPNPQDYEANRQWGQDFDKILKGIVEHRDLDDIPATPTLTDKVREKIYLNMHKYITDKMSQRYIPLTQVAISDKLSGIAGTMDLLWISPGGTVQVVDLKTSWNTVAGTSYWNNPHLLKDTSKIKTSDRIAITKKQQHAIQVNAYTKMLQVMGYHKIAAPVTKHYRIAHDNAGTVIDFVDESTVEHKPSEMEAAVNMLIPTQIGTQNRLEELEVENPLNTKEFQEDKEEALKEEEDIPAEPVYTEEEKRSLKDKVREVMNALKSYRDMLAARSKQRTDTNTSAIQEINDLSNSILISLGSGNWEAGYIQFLDYANQQTAHLIGYINNPANYNATTQKGKDDYRAMVPRAQQFIKTLQGVLQVHSFVKNNPEMLKLSLTLGDLVNGAQNSIDEAYKRIVGNNIIAENTTNPLLTNSVIAEKLIKDADIVYLNAWASDMANIDNTILENLDKKIKLTSEEKRKEGLKVKERIAEMGEKLVKVAGTRDTKVLYDIMFQRDSNGNKTGRMLSMIGDKYWKMRDEIIAPTRDLKGTGEPLQYITDPKTEEDLEYNINLSKAKKKVAEFQSPEITSYNPKTRIWSYEDGKFHYLSAEYKAERDKVMVFEGGSWIPKDGMDREVKQFRNKYMDFIPETYKMEYDNNGNPTGRVIENTDGVWYPKREHVVIRPVAADGTDMRDVTWKKLRAGNTPLEKAQMEFLEEYRDILGEQVDYLGPQQRNWYQRNYIPAVASNFLQQLGNSPKRMELIMNELKEWFTVKGYATQTEIQRQTGSLSQSLPAIYTANMRSQEQLDRIVAEIAEHDAKKATLTTTREKVEWTNKAKELETLRKIELNKLTPDQIHPDLTQGLMAFTDMTHKFRVVDAISDDLIAVENVLTNMTFYEKKRDVTGKIIAAKEKKGIDSKTYKRFITYVQQIWENDESMNKEVLDVIINKAMKGTSAVGMAFNWLGHIHNVITGQINNTIDSFGDELYTRKANMRMKLEVNKAMAAKAVQAGQLLGKSYKTPPPSSKYDALVQEFNMIEHMANSDPGKVNILGDWGYSTMQLGEWVVQSRVGNAVLDSIILIDPKGNEVSVYDAYDFDQKSGKLSIKDGYKIQSTGAEFNEKERLKIHNRIRETNKRIHGNYRDIDRTSIERYSIGKMVMQFHKWVYPAYRARFHRAKWDENLGAEGMWNEGRYRSAAAFIKGLYNKTITIEQMWKGAMEDLSKMTPEDKKKFIRDNYEGVISAEEFKNFDSRIKTIDNLIEAHKSVELLNMDTTEHRAQWLARMEDLQNEKQVIERAVDDMMVKLMEHRKNNITKAAADLLYICILMGTFILLKGIADDLPEDDPMMKKVINWMMWEADRNRKETTLFVPFLNLLEAYQLIKSPIPALGAVRDFGQMMNAMVQYPLQNEEERYLQRGPNEGRLKVWKETTDLIPIWRQYNRWLSFDNINNFYIK